VTASHAVIPTEVNISIFVLRATPSNCYFSAKVFFFISVFRSAFVIVVLTLASWLYTRHRKSKKGTYPIKILGPVPRGLKAVGTPHIDHRLLSALAPKIPVATIILFLEHIAIAKCKPVRRVTLRYLLISFT
jgi:MFS superfamily sulfate permease-like transporter